MGMQQLGYVNHREPLAACTLKAWSHETYKAPMAAGWPR